MWREIRLSISEQAEARLFRGVPRHPTIFRKTLAALNTQENIGLPPFFFGYNEAQIADPEGDTVIGMGWTKTGLRLTGIGSRACALLEEKSALIQMALIKQADAFIPMRTEYGEHGATFRPFAAPCFVQSLAVGSSQKDSFWFRASKAVQEGSSWVKEADRKLPQVIGRSLMRQCVLLINEGDDIEGNVELLLGRSISGERHWNETGPEFGRRAAIKVNSVGSHTYVKTSNCPGRLVLQDVEFSMNLALTGPWFIGRLKNEAAGQVLPATGAWTRLEKAA